MPFGLCTREKATGNPVWFLARMKCPRDGEVLWRALKCSLSYDRLHPLHLFPPPTPSRVVGRPPTLSSEALPRRYTAPSPFVKVLARMTDIYRGYALIRQESLFSASRTPKLAPRDGSISFLPSVWRPSSLWTSASIAPSVSPPTSVFFCRKKFLQGMRLAVAGKLLSRSSSSRDYSDVFNFFHLLALLFSSYFVTFFSRFIFSKRSESSLFNTIPFLLYAERNF